MNYVLWLSCLWGWVAFANFVFTYGMFRYVIKLSHGDSLEMSWPFLVVGSFGLIRSLK